ncbi:MAG: hypothetical protein J0653_05530 [Deltaproteobacteria bacterium]|nr:hypothetical protein [Deltaproteobacteria bacterium]
MKLLNLFRRICLWFVIRSLETSLDDIEKVIYSSLSFFEFMSAMGRRAEIKRELQKAQSEYSALLPVGVVKTWAV